MAYETIIVEIEDSVALIRLNRPEALNALNSALFADLAAFLDAVEHDDGVRCLILTGAGEKAFAKCQSCHTVNAGGANGISPNLHGVMGKPLGAHAGFAYSAELKAKGGNWDWDSMNEWLKNPKAYVAGTKMSFAGLSKPEDRANVIAYLKANGGGPDFPALQPPPTVPPGAAGDACADRPAAGHRGRQRHRQFQRPYARCRARWRMLRQR